MYVNNQPFKYQVEWKKTTKLIKWSFPDEKKEDLINCVSKYQHLYDKGNKHYLNRDKKDATWKEIAKELALPGKFYFVNSLFPLVSINC